MNTSSVFKLSKGKLYTQTKDDGRITCLSGSLWITFSNEYRDVVLTPGEYCALNPGEGKVVIEALTDASFSIPQRSSALSTWIQKFLSLSARKNSVLK